MISVSYMAMFVVRVRKISPVTIGLQQRTIDNLSISTTDYLKALSGSGPPADDR